MSRSAWKPSFVASSLVASIQKNGSSVSHICFQRSSILLSPRVGARLLIWNGNRFYPILVSDERVGHRAGEFAPTRKRPPLTAKAASKKGQKLFLQSMGQKTHPVGLRLGLHRKWSSSWFASSTSTTSPKYSSVVSTRGGSIRSNREDLICSFLRRLPTTIQSPTLSTSKKVGRSDGSSTESLSRQESFDTAASFAPVDLQINVGSGGVLFIVFFYAKLQGRNQ